MAMSFRYKNEGGEQALRGHFLPAADALGVFLRDLFVVVGESDEAEKEHRTQDEPEEFVRGIAPEQRADGHGENDEDSAHGRRSFFRAVQIGQFADFGFLAQRLAELEARQQHDRFRAHGERKHERGQRGRHCPESFVAKNVERSPVGRKKVEIIKH